MKTRQADGAEEVAAGESGRERVHGRAEFEIPQLELYRKDLEGLPEISLPEGYSLRHYQPGDEEFWGRIMSKAFSSFWTSARFKVYMKPHFGFQPERIIFLCYNHVPVGSASAYQWPGIPRDRGYIHMLGVLENHCGQGFGHALALACLHRFREEGFRDAMLQTESFRLPAIKHYLRLGFKPVLVTEEQRGTWEEVLVGIGKEELIEELNIGGLPVMNSFSYWWRSFLISNYMNWLGLRKSMGG